MKTKEDESLCSQNEIYMLCFANQGDYVHVIIYIWKIFFALTCSMATFYDSSKEKKNEMAREQRGTYIYILFTMEQQEEKQM
jgi:hypothetical protein